MSRQNSREISGINVTMNGHEIGIDRVANDTLPFSDVKVMLLKGEKGDQGEPGTGANPSSSDPLMDGVASAGSSSEWSRGDHVHPSDTTRMKKGVDYVTAGQESGQTLGNKATAEGYLNIASGYYSHAEGTLVTASGISAHAENEHTNAGHSYSHAEGYYNRTGCESQHVQGKYNVGKSTTAFEIGNGTANNARSNAFEVDWNGSALMKGKLIYEADTVTGTAVSQNNVNKVVASVSGNVMTLTLSHSPSSPTTLSYTIPSGYNAGHLYILASDGTTVLADKLMTDGDSYTYDIGSLTNIKIRIDNTAVSYLGEEISDSSGNVLSDKADIELISTEKSIPSSSIITVPDALPVAPKKLTAYVTPKQDLHGYSYPWAGGAGKNKYATDLLPLTDNGITVEVTDMGEIWIHGTPISTSDYTVFTIGTRPSDFVNKAVVLSTDRKINGIGFGVSDGNLNLPMSSTTTAKSTSSYNPSNTNIVINVMNNLGTINEKFKVQFELGATRTSFEPYSNICPILGWTESKVTRAGKNLFDESYPEITTSIKYRSIYVGNGTFTMSTTMPEINHGCGLFFLTGQVTSGADNASNGVHSSQTRTVTSTNGYVTVAYRIQNGEYPSSYNTQIELGSQKSAYVPFTGLNTYTLDLNGTRYGGYIEVDENGVTKFVGTHGFISDLSALNWGDQGNPNTYQASITDMLTPTNDLKCSAYPVTDYSTSGANMPDKSVKSYGSSSSKFFILKDSSYANTTELIAGISGIQLYYPLATPIEVTLSDTDIIMLEGLNNLWCDSGNVALEYLANRCYESETKVEQSEVATVEMGNTASRAYSVNEFMMWKGGLYKVTQSIASGATITSGTNVTKTTIGAVLTALLNG